MNVSVYSAAIGRVQKKKTADLAIQVTNESGSQKYKWILEVGFSQSEKSLREDAILWLKGVPAVSTVVTVSIVEEPAYRCPVSDNEDLKALGMLRMKPTLMPPILFCRKNMGRPFTRAVYG